jgi:flagellar basal body-associated protein FliL
MRFDDQPREPMPKSLKPAWIMIGLLFVVMAVTAAVSLAIAYFVVH